MKKRELAETLVNDHSMIKSDAHRIVDDVMADRRCVEKGEEVPLSGFGEFKIKESPAREGGPCDGRDDPDRGIQKAHFLRRRP
jgi:DNA-binding protein HU-beta